MLQATTADRFSLTTAAQIHPQAAVGAPMYSCANASCIPGCCSKQQACLAACCASLHTASRLPGGQTFSSADPLPSAPARRSPPPGQQLLPPPRRAARLPRCRAAALAPARCRLLQCPAPLAAAGGCSSSGMTASPGFPSGGIPAARASSLAQQHMHRGTKHSVCPAPLLPTGPRQHPQWEQAAQLSAGQLGTPLLPPLLPNVLPLLLLDAGAAAAPAASPPAPLPAGPGWHLQARRQPSSRAWGRRWVLGRAAAAAAGAAGLTTRALRRTR